MRKAVIVCSFEGKSYQEEFSIEENTPEYIIADRAYTTAILFAQTQLIAKFGFVSESNACTILERLDYDYQIC